MAMRPGQQLMRVLRAGLGGEWGKWLLTSLLPVSHRRAACCDDERFNSKPPVAAFRIVMTMSLSDEPILR